MTLAAARNGPSFLNRPKMLFPAGSAANTFFMHLAHRQRVWRLQIC